MGDIHHGNGTEVNINRLVNTRPVPVLLLASAVGFSLLGDMALYAILPVHGTVLGLGPLQIGALLSLNRWVRLVTNSGAHRILQQRRYGGVLVAALVAGSLTTAMYAAYPVVPLFVLFLTARVVWGGAWSVIRHVAVTTTIGAGPPAGAGTRLGVYESVIQVAFVAGTLGAGFLFDLHGYAAVFRTAALISLLAVPAAVAAFRRISETEGATGESGVVPDPEARATATARSRSGTESAAAPNGTSHEDRQWAILMRGFIVMFIGKGSIISTLGYVLHTRFGAEAVVGPIVIGVATLNGILIALYYGINGLGSPALGMVIDRVGSRAVETGAFLVATVMLVVAATNPGPLLLVPAVALFFVAILGARLALVARAGRAGSAPFARLMTAADLGAAAGPIAGWGAIGLLGSPEAIFVLSALLSATAVVPAMLSRRT